MFKYISILMWGIMGCTQSNSMEIVGRVSMKGSEPHTYLALYDQKRKQLYRVKNQNHFPLYGYQNKEMKLEVEVIEESMGAGFPTTVKVLKIIQVQK